MSELFCEALSAQGNVCTRPPEHEGCHETYVDGDGRRWYGDMRERDVRIENYEAEIELANIMIDDAIDKMRRAKDQKADAEVRKGTAELALHQERNNIRVPDFSKPFYGIIEPISTDSTGDTIAGPQEPVQSPTEGYKPPSRNVGQI